MAADDRDDRPKKSWREIDQGRDKSAHRTEERGTGRVGERMQRSQAYRAYKTQLNKLFDGGGELPEAMKAKLVDANVAADAKKRKEAAQTIVAAATPKAIRAALATYRESFGFPDDEEALAKLLDLDDETIAFEALTVLTRLHSEGALKRATSFKARIKTVQMTIDAPKVQQLARDLLAKLT